jgi:hypothetical protein
MRELTKSLGSFGWAMSLFGLKRLAEMVMPRATPGDPPTWQPGAPRGGGNEAFDRMTEAARAHLGDGGFHEAFRSGDQIFRAMIDMMLGGCADCPPEGRPGDPTRAWPGDRWPGDRWPGPRQPPAPGWGPMPAAATSPPPPGKAPAAGGWGPMSGAAAAGTSAAGSEPAPRPPAAAGARGWGPMPKVPPPGAETVSS